ncbi:O-antigen ligase family protein [Actinomycetospora straminea]|uniref:O-antigen ligase family protein n=1 Tax=Actinomycetospora straminea TaxID=663607 RepID=UPI0023669EB8|nr:O-antigen ligase family protein [Actinomycetospora straminea]MDD7931032.1 O-antigen ligase family protein [Actinomycetospora straminea]
MTTDLRVAKEDIAASEVSARTPTSSRRALVRATQFRRPSLVVAAVIFGASYEVSVAGEDAFGATFGDGLTVVLVILAAVLAFRSGRPALGVRPAMLLAAVAIATSASVLASTDTSESFIGYLRWMQLFVLVPAAVLIVHRDCVDDRVITGAFVGMAVFQGAIGLNQYLTGTGASYDGNPVRATGTFGASNVISMSTVVGLGLVAALGVALRTDRPWVRWIALVTALGLVAPLLVSFSRGSLIGVIVAAVAVTALARPRVLLTSAVTAVCVAAIAVLTATPGTLDQDEGGVGARLVSITASTSERADQSVIDRYSLWGAALDMWMRQPVSGVGIRSFPEYRDTEAPLSLSSSSDTEQVGQGFHRQQLLSPHNMYLLVLAEQGVIGALAVGALLVGPPIVLLWRRIRGTLVRPSIMQSVTFGMSVFVLVTFVYGDIGGPNSAVIAVVVGLTVKHSFGTKSVDQAGHRQAEPRWRATR